MIFEAIVYVALCGLKRENAVKRLLECVIKIDKLISSSQATFKSTQPTQIGEKDHVSDYFRCPIPDNSLKNILMPLENHRHLRPKRHLLVFKRAMEFTPTRCEFFRTFNSQMSLRRLFIDLESFIPLLSFVLRGETRFLAASHSVLRCDTFGDDNLASPINYSFN